MPESEHFSSDELACRCGCGLNNATPELLELAENIRHLLGDTPMIVHSCCRCSAHNREVGGVTKSKHLTGKAMDFHVDGIDTGSAYITIVSASNRGKLPLLGGIGRYSWGLHIDTEKREDGELRTWFGK